MNVETLHLSATAIMVGVIWLVQLVHYPSFYFIDEENFKEFSYFHQRNITYIVGPVMLVEFLSGLYLLPKSEILFQINMVLLVFIWLVTFFFSVKEHNNLIGGKDLESIRRLVKTNWMRTILWTIRLIILGVII